MSELDDRLLGRWRESASNSGDQVTIDFAPDGAMTYSVATGAKLQVIRLTFRTENQRTIVSDQPSAPREERTEYEFTESGELVLIFSGQRTRYRRA